MKSSLQTESITLFLKKVCGSEETVKGYKLKLERFFRHYGVNPDEVVAEWMQVKYDLRQREKYIDYWTDKIERYIYNNFEDYAPKSRLNEMTAIVSFFKNCCARGIPVEPKREKHTFVKYHNRDIKREEIKRILEHSSERDKAFFLMMAESGLRPHTLAQLRYKHVKLDFEANRVPMMIDLPSELLKDRVEHRWTFIGREGVKALRTYLKKKLPLKNEDLIFTPRRKDAPRKLLTRSTYSMIFSNLVVKLGIVERTNGRKPKPIRLYCLRKYFMNNCRYDGFDHTFKEFWMGHKTTQTHYISRDIERHREEYAKAYENLRVYRDKEGPEISELRKRLRQLLEERADMQTKFSELKTMVTELARALREHEKATTLRQKAQKFMGIESDEKQDSNP